MEQNEIGHWNEIIEKFKLWGIFPNQYPTKNEIETENLLVGGDYLENEYPKFEDIRVDDRPTILNLWLTPGLMVYIDGGAGIQITDKGRALTTFPDVIDGEQYTNLIRAFRRAKFVKSPKMNTQNVKIFDHFFTEAANLEEMEVLDTSSGVSFLAMFEDCIKLTTVPLFDVSKGKNFRALFGGCSQLKVIPKFDLSSGDHFFEMFSKCSSITEIPALNTINGTNFFQMFRECRSLVTIESIDLIKGTNLQNMFINCLSLVNVKINNLKESISFTTSPLLSQESIEHMIDNLQTANGKQISLHADTLPKVTEEYRQKALDKGFTIV